MQTLDLTDVMLPHERYLCQVCNRVRDPETELSEEPEMSCEDKVYDLFGCSFVQSSDSDGSQFLTS